MIRRVPITVVLWGLVVILTWFADGAARGSAPSGTTIVVTSVLWWGVALGLRWVWWSAVGLLGLGGLMVPVLLVVADVDVQGEVPTYLVVWGVGGLVVQLALLLNRRTRAHVGSRRAAEPRQKPERPPRPIARDEGARWRTGQP
jgi:hypothetical protein